VGYAHPEVALMATNRHRLVIGRQYRHSDASWVALAMLFFAIVVAMRLLQVVTAASENERSTEIPYLYAVDVVSTLVSPEFPSLIYPCSLSTPP
jgi:hypothetical protein